MTSPKTRTRAAITKCPATTLRRSPSFSGRGASTGSRSRGRSARAGQRRADCTPMSACRRRRRSHCSTPPFTLARLVDSSNPRLMVPAAVGSVRLAAGLADARGSVEVRRRGGNGDELIVDIAVKAADGTAVHRHPLTSLRRCGVRSCTGGSPRRRLAHVSARDRVATVARAC